MFHTLLIILIGYTTSTAGTYHTNTTSTYHAIYIIFNQKPYDKCRELALAKNTMMHTSDDCSRLSLFLYLSLLLQ